MGRLLFPKTETVKLPPVADPEPVPELTVDTDETKKGRRKVSRAETIITSELQPVTTKKTLLG